MTKSKLLFVLFILLAAIGIPMLMIGPAGSLDVRLFYSHTEATRWLDSLIYDDKTNYLINEYLDLAYIAVYTAIFYVLNGKKGFLPAVLDLWETLPIIWHLRYGTELPQYLGVVSGMKWIVGSVFILMSSYQIYKLIRK